MYFNKNKLRQTLEDMDLNYKIIVAIKLNKYTLKNKKKKELEDKCNNKSEKCK